MNLQPLKSLVPSRAMLVMLLLLGLGLGWFYVSSSAQGSHLVRRNFNHLNQITSNIDASVDALHAQVRFNQGAPCPDSSDEEACLKAFKTRLASNSPLIRDVDAVYAEIDDIVFAEDLAPLVEPSTSAGDPVPPPQVVLDQVQSPLVKYGRFASLQRIGEEKKCFDPAEFEREAEQIDSYLVEGGIGNRFFVDINLIREKQANARSQANATNSAGQGGDAASQQCLEASLALYLEIDLNFDLIQGLAQPEGYFDSIIIARADRSKDDSDSEWYGQPLPEIIFNTASGEPYANIDKLQSIFRMRSGFERYISIADLEQQHGVDRYRATLLPGEKGARNPTDIEPQRFTHSTVVPFQVGSFEHLAFVQPMQLADIEEDLLIIGVVERGNFNALKYRMPLNYLSLILVAFLVVLLSLNFIRLALIGKRGVLLRRDLHLSYISLVGMASLITVLIGNIGASTQLNAMFDDDQQSIFDRIRTEFELELAKKLALIRELDVTGPLGISFCEGKLTPEEGEGNSSKEHCTGDPVPVISARFKLDLDGEQFGIYQTHLQSSPTPPFNLASRRYFQAIRDGDTWRLDSARLQRWLPGENYTPLIQALDGQRYFLQRIESYVDSTLETAISVPLFQSELPGETGETSESVAADEPGRLTGSDTLVGARVAVARFRSLEDVVMPPGFGFAVFENRSGKVLFHNDYRRSLRENFYRATDDDSDLKAAVIAGVKMGLDLDYKGESVHAVMGPLADTPWTLVVYYRKPLVDIINFHFGVTASILSAAFIMLFLIGSGLLALTVPRLIQAWKAAEEPPPSFVPEWVYPLDGKASQYVDLTGMNLGLLFLYTGITYHLDITHSWPWLVLSTAAIYGLWHRHLCPEFYSRQLPRWMQPWVSWVPYGFALGVVLAYAAVLIAHGGLYYLLGSALVAAGLYLLMRFNEARKRRRLESQPLSQQQAALRARDLVNYRRATCVFVLMLSVSPTILLYNENFDVHEKLWVEYNNWYNSDQLRDRSAGYEAYAQRTNQASDLGDFMLKTWQGVYLPRTEVFSLQAQEEDSNSATPGAGDRELKPQVSRWPELRRKYWLPERFDQEFTIYMLVARDGIADTLDDCEARTDIEGRSYWQCANQPQVDKQVSLLKNLVKALPSFSTTGSLLESFTERTRIKHAMQEPDSDGVATTQQPSLVAIDEYDRATGLHYVMSTVFPHTRSAFPQAILFPYFLFLMVSGFFVYLLTGFLADRQLGGRFMRRKAAIDREANHDEILAGGLMVVPAGVELSTAYEQLVSSSALSVQQFGEPQGSSRLGLEQVAVSDEMVILRDFFSVIDDRRLAARVIDFLEEQVRSGKHVLVLSDIDPKYWLRTRHVGTDLPVELFHRWEALLMSLHSYCLFPPGRVCVAPSPRCFRQIWERSSMDEKLLLAGLHYENVVNYRNLSAGISLYRRGVLGFHDFQYRFTNTDFARFVARQLPRDEFRRQAASYENRVWVSFRGPIMLGLLVTLGFIAYTAQDEMRVAFSILTTVSGTLVAVGALSDRLRDFRSYIGN